MFSLRIGQPRNGSREDGGDDPRSGDLFLYCEGRVTAAEQSELQAPGTREMVNALLQRGFDD